MKQPQHPRYRAGHSAGRVAGVTRRKHTMQQGIYSVWDHTARTLVGGLYVAKHEAVAVRFFGDIAADPQTQVHRHPHDFALVRLGYVTDVADIGLPRLLDDATIILEGALWIAAQTNNTMTERNG